MMRKGFLVCLTATALGACGGLQTERNARQGAADANSEATSTLRHNAVNGPVVDNGDSFRIKRLSQVYVSTTSREAPRTLPRVFTQRQLTLNLVDLVYLDDLAQIVAKISGIPVSLAPELLSGVTKDKNESEGDDEEEAVSGSETGYQHRLRMNFSEGSLQSLLDYIATAIGISWAYENGQIRLYRFTTKTFMIASQQGSHSGQATVTNRATGSSSSSEDTSAISSSDLKTQINVDTSVWDDLRSTIPTLLSEGGKYFVSESSSTLTVHDTAINVGIVDEYVRNLNEVLSRQVQFHVRVLSVNQNDGNHAGINWDVLYNQLGSRFALTTDRGDISSPQQNSLEATVLSGPGRLVGSQFFVDALAQQGEVSEISNPQLVTLNNQPTHLIIGNRLSYVAKLESTIAANAGTTTTAELADLITGFSVLLQPTILNRNDLQVQIALDRSTLNSIQTFGNANNQSLVLQAPDVDISNSIQRVKVQTGQTIVLTGFEQVTNNNARQGVTDPDAWWSGGRKSHTSSRSTIVVLLTPVIL